MTSHSVPMTTPERGYALRTDTAAIIRCIATLTVTVALGKRVHAQLVLLATCVTTAATMGSRVIPQCIPASRQPNTPLLGPPRSLLVIPPQRQRASPQLQYAPPVWDLRSMLSVALAGCTITLSAQMMRWEDQCAFRTCIAVM